MSTEVASDAGVVLKSRATSPSSSQVKVLKASSEALEAVVSPLGADTRGPGASSTMGVLTSSGASSEVVGPLVVRSA